MKTISLIFGASGCAKEIDWLINELYEKDNSVDFRPNYFVAHKDDTKVGKIINNVPVISEDEAISKFANSSEYFVNVFVCVGSPVLKEKIVDKIINIKNFQFPNIIHPDVSYDKRAERVKFGKGVFIYSKTVLTTDVEIDSFVHINLSCTIGHDSIIGAFSTISPGVNVSGNVNLKKNTFVGTNATILENVSVVPNVIIGAGTVVTKSLNESGTYVGVPAKKIK
jgi:sugar O-acyltransferase (sialic acid O-acetyltransferase NeuD family)